MDEWPNREFEFVQIDGSVRFVLAEDRHAGGSPGSDDGELVALPILQAWGARSVESVSARWLVAAVTVGDE